ncbi:thiamine-phosphate kinase [Calidifontibacillus erzurumensis]|uniref:Thiamine-monophosphate kinase n=1 Tax=Calidifontibacillus erzurumensis TaxID=2741433 RepID=A0A8J8GH76_9BACI|nr:thiamine-phosphate kinase [Calidifontibacillus erzurumensis]NSL53141.1 thiamine-phosphate kinase [Calidifontibacillus erzurumensis]
MTIQDEFSFIKSITPKTYRQPHLVAGIGDDAALYRGDSNVEEIICLDTMIEDIHFSKKTMKPFHIGYKALASNISDIAAMGGKPIFYLVSIAIPKHWSAEELAEIYKGMENLAERFQMDLIGGDTVSTKDSLAITVTVIGRIEKGKHLLRKNAKAGDIVFVTETLGDSAAGLHLLLQYGVDYSFTKDELALVRKHQLPEPRIEIGQLLADYPRVALNDVSDGIASELNEIAEASNVSIVIERDFLPKSEGLEAFDEKEQLKWMLYGGEDYELVGTIPQEHWTSVEEKCKEKGFLITKIGYVENGPSKVLLKEAETYRLLEKLGFNHFRD